MRFSSSLLLIAILASIAAIAQDQSKPGPVVFIRGKAPVTQAGGGAGVAVKGVVIGSGSTSYGGDDETMIVASDLLKKCPDLSLTVNEETKPDYILLVNRSTASFFSGAMNQFMLLRRDKSVMYANEKGSSKGAAKDACKVIMADWKRISGAAFAAAKSPPDSNQPAPATDGWWKTAQPAQSAQTEAQK